MLLRAEIEQLNEEVKNLQVYRNHLQSLVANQQQEMASLEQQTEEIKRTRQGIVPLMYDMIEGLEEWVAQDKPIRLAARQERIEKLKELMPRQMSVMLKSTVVFSRHIRLNSTTAINLAPIRQKSLFLLYKKWKRMCSI